LQQTEQKGKVRGSPRPAIAAANLLHAVIIARVEHTPMAQKAMIVRTGRVIGELDRAGSRRMAA